jgi:glycosyltransferase involved in cell wall biosynthesis
MISLVLFLDFALLGWTIYAVFRLWKAFALYKIRKQYTLAIDAPSVSVCIPARNEMHAMTACLERVLASDYKKMEVIVYDDSSADETSMLVRSFAQAGVRFVAGSDLPEGWLGKNHALDVLAREASGTYVIFMDVDTQIKTTTISRLVSFLMTERLEMLSVVPMREDMGRASVLFSPLRYWWLLVLPWISQPVAASMWMIRRVRLLEEFEGLRQLPGSVVPEAVIAGRLKERYQPLMSSPELGVSFEKKLMSQYETSRRLLYPLFGGTWYGALGGLVLLVLLAWPSTFIISAIATGWDMLHTFSLVILVCMILSYGIYLRKMWLRGWWYGMLLWPVIIVQELVLFIASIVGYFRGTISWKGRSVTGKR